MNYLIGAIGGVFIVLAVLYFVLRAPAPKYRKTGRETNWGADPHSSYGGSYGPSDAGGADSE